MKKPTIEEIPKNEIFICVHDQNIIIDYEKSFKFNILKNYRYIFLGDRPNDLIKNNPKVIIARNYKNNLEDYPYLTAYTGWYLLWKNNLIKTKYVTLLEYDVILHRSFEQIISKFTYDNCELIGYIPLSVNNYHFINNPNWVLEFFTSFKTVYNQNIENTLKVLINKNPNLLWSSTSNTTFRIDIFNEFMKWFHPVARLIKNSKTSGHAFERSVSFFYFTKNKKMLFTKGILQHLQMDSHKTQGHNVDYSDNMSKLLKNEIL